MEEPGPNAWRQDASEVFAQDVPHQPAVTTERPESPVHKGAAAHVQLQHQVLGK